MRRNIMVIFSACFFLTSFFHLAFADHNEHHEKNESKYFTPVNNDTFKQECGACHLAYQPGLLPSGSWEKILSNLPSHFEEEISLDDKSKNIIGGYLRANAA